MLKRAFSKVNTTALKTFAGFSFMLSLVLANSACFCWEYDGEEMPESVKSMRR